MRGILLFAYKISFNSSSFFLSNSSCVIMPESRSSLSFFSFYFLLFLLLQNLFVFTFCVTAAAGSGVMRICFLTFGANPTIIFQYFVFIIRCRSLGRLRKSCSFGLGQRNNYRDDTKKEAPPEPVFVVSFIGNDRLRGTAKNNSNNQCENKLHPEKHFFAPFRCVKLLLLYHKSTNIAKKNSRRKNPAGTKSTEISQPFFCSFRIFLKDPFQPL